MDPEYATPPIFYEEEKIDDVPTVVREFHIQVVFLIFGWLSNFFEEEVTTFDEPTEEFAPLALMPEFDPMLASLTLHLPPCRRFV